MSTTELSGTSKIIIDTPPYPDQNYFGIFQPRTKIIYGGMALKGPYWTKANEIFGYRIVTLAVLIVISHEIGHSIVGADENKADRFAKRKLEKTYKKRISWPPSDYNESITFADLLNMIYREKLV